MDTVEKELDKTTPAKKSTKKPTDAAVVAEKKVETAKVIEQPAVSARYVTAGRQATWARIAIANGTTVEKLQELNPDVQLRLGSHIRVR